MNQRPFESRPFATATATVRPFAAIRPLVSDRPWLTGRPGEDARPLAVRP